MPSDDPEIQQETNVQVAVRCRPLNEREKQHKRTAIVQCKTNTNEVAVLKRKTYSFDHVFGQYSTQKDIFKTSVKGAVDEALAGYNCTVFAYGQTGTGKTYTMLGALEPDHEHAGIIPRCIRYIFDTLQSSQQEYSVKISFLQLYNEECKDLLAADGGKKLRLMDDVRRGGIYCQNLLEVTTTTASHVFQLLEAGVKNRITSETLMNENSSRSHSIFTIRIHSKEHNPAGEDLLKIGQLNLVDLAGSECVGRSGARNARAREAGNINQSLLTLGRVITALVDNHPHIPYRDSKLTRLLQESLGGRAKTTIIATLSPGVESMDETLSTLEYAHRARSIRNKPEVNQKMTKHALLKEYGSEIESLRNALEAARQKDGIYLPPAQYDEMQQRLAGQAAQVLELEDQLDVRSKACKEMEDLVDDQRQQLEHAKNTQRELEGDIARKSEQISELESLRDALRKELDASKERVHAYEQHELVLLSNGKKATDLFDKRNQQMDQVLDANKRKERIAKMNSELVNGYSSKVLRELSDFDTLFMEQERTHAKMAEEFGSLMKRMELAHSERLVELVKQVDELEVSLDESKALAHSQHQTARTLASENQQSNEKLGRMKLDRTLLALQAVIDCVKSHSQTSMEALADAKKCLMQWTENSTGKLRTAQENLQRFVHGEKESLGALIRDLETLTAQERTKVDERSNGLSELIQQHQRETHGQVEAIKEHMERLVSDLVRTQQGHRERQVEIIQMHSTEYSKALVQLQNEASKGVGKTIQQMQVFSDRSKQCEEEMEAEVRISSSLLHESISKETRAMAEYSEKQREDLKEIVSHERAFIQERNDADTDQLTKWKKSFDAHEAELNALAAAEKGKCEALRVNLTVVDKEFVENAASTAKVQAKSCALTCSILSHGRDTAQSQSAEVKTFVEGRTVDAPNGTTPTKRVPVDFPAFKQLELTKMDDIASESLVTGIPDEVDLNDRNLSEVAPATNKENIDSANAPNEIDTESMSSIASQEIAEKEPQKFTKRMLSDTEMGKESSLFAPPQKYNKATRSSRVRSLHAQRKRARLAVTDVTSGRSKAP